MTRGGVWRCLFPPTTRTRGGSWLAWLWRNPALRGTTTPLWCACSGPVFFRGVGDAYECELCGGRQRVVRRVPAPLFLPPASGDCVSVTPGLGYGEGVRRVIGELDSHLAAVGTTYAALTTRLPVALRSSCRSLAAYRAWRGRVRAPHVPLDDVRLAVYALRFALAVYALPYELGYFSSVVRSLGLLAPRQNRYALASTADQVSSIRRILFGGKDDPLLEVAYARYSATLQQPCFTIFLDHRLRRVVIAFRGTLSLADVIADLGGGYASVCLGTYRSPATGETEKLHSLVPRGFYANVMEAGGHILHALGTIRASYPDYAIMGVGHSLGAIEAILFHLLFFFPTARQATELRTIAFAPAPCIDRAVVAKVNELLGEEAMTSWVYGLDGVSRLQAGSLRGLFFPASPGPAPEGENAKKAAELQQQQQQLPLLAIPGRVLHLAEDNAEVLQVPVNAPWREQMFLGKEALLHHFPSVYGASLYKILMEHEKSTNVSGEVRQ
ncbi:putative lipase [Trypanosoma conorhini]|uniref:sn-1-specific diacylglycerol lipase n=1 Tax=Trypanosoma conorhini TaxID=83891 RepID=A0A3R7NV51_9TRYP|nr:putative lipase [Trypanosoma conorhini]RNF27571.1 putative lipase [Trypanosoma conorhini]